MASPVSLRKYNVKVNGVDVMGLNITIIGVGLIGGSIGLALRDSARVRSITGIDSDARTLDTALELGAIDRAAGLENGVQEADIVFICSPLGTIPDIVRSIRNYLQPGCIVTDVGSAKQAVMDIFMRELPPGIWGIGGHPMAGSEQNGVNAADAYLFENAVYVLTTPPNLHEKVLRTLQDLVTDMGARVILMDAARHDDLVAAISHLPHLTAVALVNQAATEPEALVLAAGGFRDTTRVASSDSIMWEDIIRSNRRAIIEQLDGFIAMLIQMREDIQHGETAKIREKLEQARQIGTLFRRKVRA